MTTMPDAPESLAAALAKLQTKLPKIGKDKTARVTSQRTGKTHTYDYANLATVSERILPLMGELGLAFLAKPTFGPTGEFALVYRLLHVSGQSEDGAYPLPSSGSPQEIGSAITYARRYCLCAVTGVAPDDDDDDAQAAETAHGLPANKDGSTSRSRVTDAQLEQTGQMTKEQMAAHNKLEREVKGTGPQGTERLAATPGDDAWLLPSPSALMTEDQPGSSDSRQRKQIFFKLEQAGFATPEAGRAECVRIIGREIETRRDLSFTEAAAILAALDKEAASAPA
jgi:hypothetical protein